MLITAELHVPGMQSVGRDKLQSDCLLSLSTTLSASYISYQLTRLAARLTRTAAREIKQIVYQSVEWPISCLPLSIIVICV